MTIARLSILGVGLLGGSIGLATRTKLNPCQIVGYGRRAQTLSRAKTLGAIDEFTTDPAQAVRNADLVILCTPVGTFGQLLAAIAPALNAGTIVTDVGSTKRSVVRLAQQILPHEVHFVGSHPMAGSENHGIEFARADLYHDALCITTPTEKTDPSALQAVESFWQQLGMRITRLTPDEHDRLLADVSHLPHAVAAALVLVQGEQALPLAGRGFLDATRIAAGDGALWRDIFLDNADQLRLSLARLRGQLDCIESLLDPAQAQQLKAYLDAAAERRRSSSGQQETRP